MFKKVEIENFMGHSGAWEFGRCNLLTGPNESGKTTIGAAIVYALWGTTLTGGTATDGLVSKGTKGCRVVVMTEKARIERAKSRGGTTVTLNGNPTTPTDLDKLLGEGGLTFDIFMGVYWPGWYMAQDERRRRSLLMSLLPPIDRIAAMDTLTAKPGLSQQYRIDLTDLDWAATTVNARIRTLEKTISQWEGEIAGMGRAAKPTGKPADIPALESGVQAAKAIFDSFTLRIQAWVKYEQDQLEDARLNQEWHRKRDALLKEAESLAEPNCPTCGQKLPEKSAAMRKINARIKEVDAGLKQTVNPPKLKAQKPDVLCPEQADIDRTESVLAECRAKLAIAKEAENASADVGQEIEKIKANRAKAQAERADLELMRDALKPVGGICRYELHASMDAIKAAAGALEIITEEALKGGQVRDCLKVSLAGIEYERLSTGARKKADLMMSRMLDKLSGGKVPVFFVDDADLIDCEIELPEDRQVFLCRVAPEGELTVTHQEEVKP